jgi:hypothetical protein
LRFWFTAGFAAIALRYSTRKHWLPAISAASGMPVETVVRSIAMGLIAAAAWPIVAIVPVRRYPRALTKCKADEARKANQADQRNEPVRQNKPSRVTASRLVAHFGLPRRYDATEIFI